MTRYYSNGVESGEVIVEENIQFSHQWVLDDKFLVYTWHTPEIQEELPSGSFWKAEQSVKTIFYGNLYYKDNILDLLKSTASEFALFQFQREQNGTITETGYGYKFEEDVPFQSLDGNIDDLASKVSFSYSNDPTTIWGPTSPKLSSFPISDDRSVIEESVFGNYILEGWIYNPFNTLLTLTDLEAYNYIASNNDLISAFGIDIEAAKSHYTNYGISEGRSLTSFSASDYLAKYSDLSDAFGNDQTLALKHYIQSGYEEGRTDSSIGSSSGSTTASPKALSDFEALNYIASYSDLISVFGTNTSAASSHYVNNGYAEGRTKDNFDEWGYLASNNDLMTAFGSNTTEAIKHYISYGKLEGRSTNIFNAESYLNNYADLKNAFGNDHTLATKHYVEHGFNEGRVF